MWFRSPGADSRPAAVSVLSDLDGEPVGAGVLLADRHLLTCAHVVNDALGNDQLSPDHPGAVRLRVRVQGADVTVAGHARLTTWIAPRPGGGGAGAYEWHGDLAVLLLEESLPESIEPPRWVEMAERQLVRAWHGTAERGWFADAEVTECNGRFGYVDALRGKLPVARGFSGGPLWSRRERAVVGLVTAKLDTPGEPHRAWGIPWQRIRTELAGAGAARLTAHPGDAPLDHPCYPALVDLLDGPPPSARGWARYARAVARECGLEHPAEGAPSAEEFARLLLVRERALAALVGAVRPDSAPAADALLAIGRQAGLRLLLSPGEYAGLIRMLRALPAAAAARIPAAVRAALSLAPVPARLLAADGEHTEELVRHLEQLHGDSWPSPDGTGPVPGLLRVAEFVAAGCCPPGPRETLRGWNERVAHRLGIHGAALRDRREEAAQWARRSRRPVPRVLVALDSGGAGGDRYLVRLWCDDGTGPRRVSEDENRPRTADEAAREIFQAVASLRRPDGTAPLPVIEMIVDRESLEIPFDEWNGDPLGILPRVLGVEYPVVVNCPELREKTDADRLADWRERWRRLDEEEPLHIDADTAAGQWAVYGLLMERRFVARVSLDVPPSERQGILQLCLAAGVPVVLWDRSGEPGSPAVRYAAKVPTGGLAEAVRVYRSKTLQRPAEYPGKPVLAWADAERPLPTLELADPDEADATAGTCGPGGPAGWHPAGGAPDGPAGFHGAARYGEGPAADPESPEPEWPAAPAGAGTGGWWTAAAPDEPWGAASPPDEPWGAALPPEPPAPAGPPGPIGLADPSDPHPPADHWEPPDPPARADGSDRADAPAPACRSVPPAPSRPASSALSCSSGPPAPPDPSDTEVLP